MKEINLDGPARFFADHQAAHAAAVLGAALAGTIFVRRGLKAHGWQRAGWFALAIFQIVQVAGLIHVRRR